MTSAESKSELFTVATGDGGDAHQNQPKKLPFYEHYIQPCLAEVLGSTLFMFVGCVSVMGNMGISGSIQPALAHGLALAIAIAIFGEISGGHFNPAVSVCVYLIGGMELMLLVPYVLSQMLGGVIAASLAKAVTTNEAFANATGAAFSAVQTSHGTGSATVAEMIMTLFLTMVVSMGAVNGRTRSQLAPFCIGLTVTANILAGGSHFNPPFTIAIWLCGGIQLTMVVPYLISQIIGGVLGAAMSKVMTSHENYVNATGAAFTILKSEEQLGKVVFAEMAMTCLVTMVVLLGAVNGKSKSPMVPFMVGCTVIVNVLAGGDISGTCLNPARAFGPALMANYWTYHWVYWVGPIGGGLVAAALVRLLLGDGKIRVILK
ncbi:hypothetical protein cypCar_00019584 [Cyprinus carpio]|nr:hypothetical protein cypCar_00019584 [Cyprinus carpio]